MSCEHLRYDLSKYNACKAQATAYARSEQTAQRQAAEQMQAKQQEIAAQYAAGGALRDIRVGPDYQHQSIDRFLPNAGANVHAGSGAGPNKGLLVGGILVGGMVFMGVIFMMLRTKPPRRGYGRYDYRGRRP